MPQWQACQQPAPRETLIEAPASLKWTEYEHSLHLGAFSYQVSGYCFGARIGHQNHPMHWVSTSPAFYLGDRLFDLDGGFDGYHSYKFEFEGPPTRAKITRIGNDVWIGHHRFFLLPMIRPDLLPGCDHGCQTSRR